MRRAWPAPVGRSLDPVPPVPCQHPPSWKGPSTPGTRGPFMRSTGNMVFMRATSLALGARGTVETVAEGGYGLFLGPVRRTTIAWHRRAHGRGWMLDVEERVLRRLFRLPRWL